MKRLVLVLLLLTACQSSLSSISWREAFSHVGEQQTVCGNVMALGRTPQPGFVSISYLLLGDAPNVSLAASAARWSDRSALGVVLVGQSLIPVAYIGQRICIRGTITRDVNKDVFLNAVELPN